jgi:hypothetical protein
LIAKREELVMQRVIVRAGLVVCALGMLGTANGQGKSEDHLPAYFGVATWTAGTHTDALRQSASGSTIPLSSYSWTASKDGKPYSGVLAGQSPISSSQTGALNAVVVPLKVVIGSNTFDPNAPNSCDSGFSALSAFQGSPLVVGTSITFGGTAAINAQYIDGFRQAEFFNDRGSGYPNYITYSSLATQTLTPGRYGTTYSSGCHLLGILSYSWLDSYLRNTVMPSLGIQPNTFAIFLMKNVVESTSMIPSVRACCILGYHGASGSPAQTYAVIDWDTTNDWSAPGIHDASIAAHEIGEWMDDPLGNNPTPAWGGIGQVSSCQSNLENGDPLTGTDMPTITGSNGYSYHLQELAFFSWYYNAQSTPSLGAGGKFSANVTFGGPAKACPPGGTY